MSVLASRAETATFETPQEGSESLYQQCCQHTDRRVEVYVSASGCLEFGKDEEGVLICVANTRKLLNQGHLSIRVERLDDFEHALFAVFYVSLIVIVIILDTDVAVEVLNSLQI